MGNSLECQCSAGCAGGFAYHRGIQAWLDDTHQRRTLAPGSQPLEALQRAAGLCSRLLRAFGGRGARLLDRETIIGGLAVTLSIMAEQGVTAATVGPIRAVCAAMAAMLRLSDVARWQLTSGTLCRRMSWEAAAAAVRQVGQSERLISCYTSKRPPPVERQQRSNHERTGR